MATTTPNFGWAVPTSTDLVKDGALAIETLGDSIDASLVDLKGGTTGQVLAKATGTDMDFTWTTASASSTYLAGKNFIINGAMDIWQRGTSFTVASGVYMMDRFYNTGNTSLTVTQDTDVPTSPAFTYSAKCVGTGTQSFSQRIESANSTPLAGQTVTISIYAKKTAGTGALNVNLYYPNVKDTYGAVTQIGSALVLSASPSSSWTRYSVTTTLPANVTNGLLVLLDNVNTHTIYLTGLQLEIASSASGFSRNAANIGLELAACQRYYWRNQTTTGFVIGDYYTTTRFFAVYKLPTTMRINPTFAASGTAIATVYSNGASRASTNILVSDSSQDFGQVEFVTAAATAGNGGHVVCSTGGSYLEWSAEL